MTLHGTDPLTTSTTPRVASSRPVPVREAITGAGLERLLQDALGALENLIAFDSAVLLELKEDLLRVRELTGTKSERQAIGGTGSLLNSPACQEACSCGFPVAFARETDKLVDAELGLPAAAHSLVVPLVGPQGVHGVLLLMRRTGPAWSTGMVELLDVIGRLLGSAMEYGEESLRSGAARQRAEARSRMLEHRSDAVKRVELQTSAAMRFVREHANRLASGSAPIAILGEAGSGKEVLARAIHSWSERADGPFVVFACAAHEPRQHVGLLFGSEDGAACVALAEGGTLYLDDVERLAPAAQTLLLEHLGRDSSVRVIAGSPTDLSGLSEALYFALAAFALRIPPLRSRREDVGLIAGGYLCELAEETGDGPWELAPRALEWLERQDWPGNVRELVNVLDRATILSADPVLDFGTPPTTGAPPLQRGGQAISSLREVEKRHIERVLAATNGQIYGPQGAAELLDINPNTLRSRMKKLGLGGARSFRRSHGATEELE